MVLPLDKSGAKLHYSAQIIRKTVRKLSPPARNRNAMVPWSKTRAFFIPGSGESLLSKADRDKKWRTKCGTIVLRLTSPTWGSPEPAAQGGGNPVLSAWPHRILLSIFYEAFSYVYFLTNLNGIHNRPLFLV